MSVWANFADNYLRGMRDKSMRSTTELAREIQQTNLSNWSSGVQIPREICVLVLGVICTKRSWIITSDISGFWLRHNT